MSPSSISVRARWIIPVESPPIPNGTLVARAGRIAEMGSAIAAIDVVDLGDVALLPALVNAHTHLEFSELEQPIGPPGLAFTDWIRQVVAWKADRDSHGSSGKATLDDRRLQAIQRGLLECVRTGTGTLGEIATSPNFFQALHDTPLTGVSFLELIGLAPARQAERLTEAREYLDPHASPASFTRGLSPHAPYTVHRDLLSRVVERSCEERFPLAMHLAESPAEIELLRTGTGPLRELLESLGAWEPGAFRHATRPLDYLRMLASGHQSLVIHGNYLDAEEIAFIGQHRDRLSLVYCPRTHARFGHDPYPLDSILASGVQLALATDSRASNPNLNLWEELQFAVQRHSAINPQVLLRAVTLDAARSLALHEEVGSLRVGKLANFVAIELPTGRKDDPWEFLSDGGCKVSAVFLRGNASRSWTT